MNMSNDLKNSYTKAELSNFQFEQNRDFAFQNLKNDNADEFLKIFSILNIDNFLSPDEANIFFSHLTNHQNPIREAVAYKLEQIAKDNITYFYSDFAKSQIIHALLDINPNVSRAICNILQDNPAFAKTLYNDIIAHIKSILLKISDDEKSNNKKSHAKNKLFFSLYWLLEGLFYAIDTKNCSDIYEILNLTINFSAYTIREKTAKILAYLPNCPIELLQKAKTDVNFYVKNQVYDKINKD